MSRTKFNPSVSRIQVQRVATRLACLYETCREGTYHTTVPWAALSLVILANCNNQVKKGPPRVFQSTPMKTRLNLAILKWWPVLHFYFPCNWTTNIHFLSYVSYSPKIISHAPAVLVSLLRSLVVPFLECRWQTHSRNSVTIGHACRECSRYFGASEEKGGGAGTVIKLKKKFERTKDSVAFHSANHKNKAIYSGVMIQKLGRRKNQ
jgi:hypothetical protein